MTPHRDDADGVDRREFLKSTAAASVGLFAAGFAPQDQTRATRSPNEKVVVAAIGLNGRGNGVAMDFARTANTEVGYVCDVDKRLLTKHGAALSTQQKNKTAEVVDFRRILDDKNVDAVFIATPDHWHAPMAILALQAGKHVYIEKPCSHNPREGELLVAAQQKYNRLVQMGNQQRSAPRSIEVINEIRNGLIGRPYLARTWYSNARTSIGRGKPASVPDWLDYELWQGPAPREPFRDNVVHYNWHWFTTWGTGEICNNGNHEIDIARWALGVDFPSRVVSSGGRYHFQDDWQWWDTQEVNFEFEGGKQLVWHGQSCNSFALAGRGRGTSVHGTNGTVVMDRNGYTVYDAKNAKVRESIGEDSADPLNPVASDRLTTLHIANFVNAIRTGEKLTSPIDEGHKSTLLCHLGNIAQRTGRALRIDSKNGHVLDDADAMQSWSRRYEPGWEVKV